MRYPPTSPAQFVKRDVLEHWEPYHHAGGPSPWIVIPTLQAGWAPTAYTVIVDPLANDFLITHFTVSAIGVPDVATLAAGSLQIEVVEADSGGGGEIVIWEGGLVSASLIAAVDTNLLGGSFMFPCGPRLVRAGRRLAFRIAQSVPGSVARTIITLYPVGYTAATPPGYPVYDYGRRMSGLYPNSRMKILPKWGTFNIVPVTSWVKGAYVTIIDPAPFDLFVWGISDYDATSLIGAGREYFVATGPSGGADATLVDRLVLPVANYTTLRFGASWAWRPLLVQKGERLAIAGAAGGVTALPNMQQMVHYEET